MKSSTLHALVVAVTIPFITPSLLAQRDNQFPFIEEILITGGTEKINRLPGSAHYIDSEQLAVFAYSDVQRIAREIPGVSIQVEDGYGLRPNISIRGVTTERSSRITLLEDNVLIAPAPYAAPSAYYFPTAGRFAGFEVVKGPAAITQGPLTIGGALNMISTPIPQRSQGNLLVEGGEDATYRLHATYGGYNQAGFGFLVETHQWRSDGFQNIDRSYTDTGLNVEDYTIKLAWAPVYSRHKGELKLQYAQQDSNQSYLGLTDADFVANADRRYGLSDLDNISTAHEQVILRYEYSATQDLTLNATAYNNEHARNWFKTEGIDLDGSDRADSLSRTGWASIINDINLGNGRDGFATDQLQAILDGNLDTAPGSIDVRANSRDYFSRGIQFGLNWQGGIGSSSHSLQAGVRVHRDEEDRLQYDSSFQQLNGELVLNDVGVLGAAGNRVQNADALAIHVYDQIEWSNWLLTLGVRYEDIELSRARYNGGADRLFRDGRNNDVQVWLPGFGVSYSLNENLVILGGVHKGFTAPTNSPGVAEEEALNYEFGFRYQDNRINAEAIWFLSDYENLLGVCTASSGTDCDIGDAFNGDAATVSGLEFLLSTDFSQSSNYSVPFMLTYTWINGEFDTNIADTAFFGDVSAGDPIPYIPEHQYRVSLGVETLQWGVSLSANYVDEVCVRASCQSTEKTDDTLTLDLSVNVQLSDNINVFGRIENLTDQEDILGRHPYGARPNKVRTVAVGVRVRF
ncbi:MAG: TonB-dependent receptor [Gammaproteobacteria bacterium]|nr:TonB-dependent receptor [Gammaproteobacteria bacterium]